jgi:hypothetical protein
MEYQKERKETSTGEVFEKVMVEYFLNLGKIIKLHIQEAELIPNRINTVQMSSYHN